MSVLIMCIIKKMEALKVLSYIKKNDFKSVQYN